MLNVAMREGCILGLQHAEQCIGPGHGAKSLAVSSVFQWQRLWTDPLLQAVGDGQVYVTLRGGKSPSLTEWRHLVDKKSLSLGLPWQKHKSGALRLHASAGKIIHLWSRNSLWVLGVSDQAWWCKCSCIGCSAVSLVWRFDESGLLCGV